MDRLIILKLDIQTGDVCSVQKDFCKNCHDHYSSIRPSIKGVYVSKQFSKDLKDEEKTVSIMESVLKCSHLQFTELHKFEKHVGKYLIFRAKIDGSHIVYSIDKERKVIIFLRYFDNYTKYRKFLEDDPMIKSSIKNAV